MVSNQILLRVTYGNTFKQLSRWQSKSVNVRWSSKNSNVQLTALHSHPLELNFTTQMRFCTSISFLNSTNKQQRFFYLTSWRTFHLSDRIDWATSRLITIWWNRRNGPSLNRFLLFPANGKIAGWVGFE